jgi:hypothetical protein
MFSASVCTLLVETVLRTSMSNLSGPLMPLTASIQLMNLFDEAISIERDGVLVFEEKPGMAISASAKYDF